MGNDRLLALLGLLLLWYFTYFPLQLQGGQLVGYQPGGCRLRLLLLPISCRLSLLSTIFLPRSTAQIRFIQNGSKKLP